MTSLPAGEQHTGTLNLAGHGNPPISSISEEIAEAATIAWYEKTPGVTWQEAGKYERAAMLARSRIILEAAYPAIRQQVAEQIAAELSLEAIAAALHNADRLHEYGGTWAGGTCHSNCQRHFQTLAKPILRLVARATKSDPYDGQCTCGIGGDMNCPAGHGYNPDVE